MKKFITYCLLSTAICLSFGSSVVAATINGFNFDLDQFIGASVTTTVGINNTDGSLWDNNVGVNEYTLGELATDHFVGLGEDAGDVGDFISLGDNAPVGSLTLTYGTPFYIGTGQSALFVVYEQSGRTQSQSDPGRTGWEISFNGGNFVKVVDGASSVSLFDTYPKPRANSI